MVNVSYLWLGADIAVLTSIFVHSHGVSSRARFCISSPAACKG